MWDGREGTKGSLCGSTEGCAVVRFSLLKTSPRSGRSHGSGPGAGASPGPGMLPAWHPHFALEHCHDQGVDALARCPHWTGSCRERWLAVFQCVMAISLNTLNHEADIPPRDEEERAGDDMPFNLLCYQGCPGTHTLHQAEASCRGNRMHSSVCSQSSA